MNRTATWAKRYEFVLVVAAFLLFAWGAVSIDQGHVVSPLELLAALCAGAAAVKG